MRAEISALLRLPILLLLGQFDRTREMTHGKYLTLLQNSGDERPLERPGFSSSGTCRNPLTRRPVTAKAKGDDRDPQGLRLAPFFL
jgi:hypothetical protein